MKVDPILHLEVFDKDVLSRDDKLGNSDNILMIQGKLIVIPYPGLHSCHYIH